MLRSNGPLGIALPLGFFALRVHNFFGRASRSYADAISKAAKR